ncbi:MAG TPA: hypothetical protein VIG48_02000 [Jatrophihabitans sp.]|jgi:hypothetical protein
MTVHQCPKCELKFSYKTEVDDHCRHDHPEFRHEYPAVHHDPEPLPHAPPPPAHAAGERHAHIGAGSFGKWLQPTRPRAHRAADDRRQPSR